MINAYMSDTSSNEPQEYYHRLATEDLLSLYKRNSLDRNANDLILQILNQRGVSIDIENHDAKAEIAVKQKKNYFYSIGIAGFLFGVSAPVICLLYELLVWFKSGVWPGYTNLDLLHSLSVISEGKANYYIYIENWTGVTRLSNWFIHKLLNMSLIFGLFLFGFSIFGITEVINSFSTYTKKFSAKN